MNAPLQQAIGLLRARPRASYGEGATNAEIERLQAELAVRLSDDYRGFLGEVGWAAFSAFEVYGINVGALRHMDVARETLDERTICEPRLPHHLIPVMNNGSGDLYCIDTSDPDGRIVQHIHDNDEEDRIQYVAPNFGQWLLDLLQAPWTQEETIA